MSPRKNKPYIVTRKKVNMWFNLINATIFISKLPPFSPIRFIKSGKNWALTRGRGHDSKIKKLKCGLTIHKTFPSELIFQNVLFHEMIHYNQWITEIGLSHGKSFKIWKFIGKIFGFNLQVEYSDFVSTQPIKSIYAKLTTHKNKVAMRQLKCYNRGVKKR